MTNIQETFDEQSPHARIFFKNDLFCSRSSRKYSVGELVGRGEYGLLVKGVDKANSRPVSIKQINLTDLNPIDVKNNVRENIILHGCSHKNIISLLDIYLADTQLFIVTDHCGYDLRKVIDMNGRPGVVSKFLTHRPSDYLWIFYQILDAVDYIHSIGVIHRDLTPENITLSANMCIKIYGFRSARVVEKCSFLLEEDHEYLTEYMVTRWYRAPEVCLIPGKYGKAQDIWSIACTFSELFRNAPLFPGKNTVCQLKLIARIVQVQSDDDLDFEMTDRSRSFMANLPVSDGKTLVDSLKGADRIHINLRALLLEMLKFNPCRRITATDALKCSMFDDFNTIKSIDSDDKGKSCPCWNKYNRYMDAMNYVSDESELLDLLKDHVDDMAYELNPLNTENDNICSDLEGMRSGPSMKSPCSATGIEPPFSVVLENESKGPGLLHFEIHHSIPSREKKKQKIAAPTLVAKKTFAQSVVQKTFSYKSPGDLFMPPPADLLTPSGRQVAASPLSKSYTVVREVKENSESPLRNPFKFCKGLLSPCPSAPASPSSELPSRCASRQSRQSITSPFYNVSHPNSPSPFLLHSNFPSPVPNMFFSRPVSSKESSTTSAPKFSFHSSSSPLSSPTLEDVQDSITSALTTCTESNTKPLIYSSMGTMRLSSAESQDYDEVPSSISSISSLHIFLNSLLSLYETWRNSNTGIFKHTKKTVKVVQSHHIDKEDMVEELKEKKRSNSKPIRHMSSKVLVIDVKPSKNNLNS
mmetsp:Transcript_36255/g.36930  ORF Transcript_36255/g.36930 Transcript_36255/m.36930 type:complete len:755 (-) Transcript_36255:165-2429(-)